MSPHQLLAGYDRTDEAADALALGCLLAERLDRELVVARVVTNGGHPKVTDRDRERMVRDAMAETRAALLAALPEAPAVELTPILDPSVARGLHDLARAEGAEALVVGASHHHRLGRLLLGSGPELVVDGAPCPVFVAPPGFRDHAGLAPEVIGVAYDGSDGAHAALRYAAALADRLGDPLRVVTVQPPWYDRPAGARHDVGAADARARSIVEDVTGGRVELDLAARHGRPVDELLAETRGNVGVLVLGSHGRGPVRRMVLGSVSAAVLRASSCPVAVAAG